MAIRAHFGVSIDGFVATPDEMPTFDSMPDFDPGYSYGGVELSRQCPNVLVGRKTFEAGHAYWTAEHIWAWEGKKVYVLTSRPLPEKVHDDVFAPEGGPAGVVQQLRADNLAGDVHLLGGARTLRAFYQQGAIDRLEIITLPLLLGAGIPLFPLGPALLRLQLAEHQIYPDGAVKHVYKQL